MAIARNGHGQMTAICDNCGDPSEEYDSDSFQELVADLKSTGWKIFRDGEDWFHHCPECNK